jgi:hypothetical protein
LESGNIDAVIAVNGYPRSTSYKPEDGITGYRGTAPGQFDPDIINALYDYPYVSRSSGTLT